MKELKSKPKTIKVAIRVWTEIKELKEKGENINDLIENMIYNYKLHKEKTSQNTRLKKIFIEVNENLNLECNYNYIKRYMPDFKIDLKFCKVMTKTLTFNPSHFFGLCGDEKYYSKEYMELYLKTILLILEKELRIKTDLFNVRDFNEQDWIDLYELYKLGNKSLDEDILFYLKKMKDKPSKDIIDRIKDSEMVKRGIQ